MLAALALYLATAYCQPGKTQSGVRVRTGIVAADPRFLPVGSVVRIVDGVASGIYTVMDTGARVKGHQIDIFIPDCARAQRFGEQRVRLRILRHGWNPKASADDR
jgi:3D (Asp-Asp-Asp) domain-containing protein